MNISELTKLVEQNEHIYIMGHVNPDGDCVGATLALALLLEKQGSHVKVLLKDVPDTYEYLPLGRYVQEEVPNEVDLLITLDSGDRDRFGIYNELLSIAKTIVNIDHHISNPQYGDYNIVDGHMSSTCELLYTMMDDKSLCDKEIASCLYTGIIYDTGIFKHSNTTAHTHQVAGALIEYGINFSEIINTVFFYKSYKGLLVQKIAIERIEILEDNQISISYITVDDMKSLKAYKKHTESIVQMLNEIKGVRCAVFIYEIKSGIFKVSLRAKDTIDVCAVAKAFGGGGHIKAAGCTIESDIEDVKSKLLYEIKKQL